ncbi:MAG: HAD-IIB family hydrolase [Deltaproteobacteria bacterium]|nr:HAD-IIB family hydrolase [Deltaproteobacteria bacterium]
MRTGGDSASMTRGGQRTDLVIFTDLDGTLLDHDTYGWGPAVEALERCRERGVPLVLVSSKTRAEMELLRKALGLDWPFVPENGGGIVFPAGCPQAPPAESLPDGGGGHVLHLGVPYDVVARSLREIREELSRPDIRGFSDMGAGEIARLTGLSPEDAGRAAQREYDEPFVMNDPGKTDLDLLERAAQERGLQVTAGGRFLHLFGGCDKGKAVSLLTDWFRSERPAVRTAGLGDSPNDLPMLMRVDEPVLVRSSRPIGDMAEAVPGIRITGKPGPDGWNRAVLDLLTVSVNA